MARKEKLSETVSFRVSGKLYDNLDAISLSQRRELSEVARALLERGVEAYKRDHFLFEPTEGMKDIKMPWEYPDSSPSAKKEIPNPWEIESKPGTKSTSTGANQKNNPAKKKKAS